MRKIDERVGKEGGSIFDAATTVPAIYYHANLDVNTDGTARSYHPDDPWARFLAVNNLGNAFTSARDADGEFDCDVAKRPCLERFMAAYEIAYAANFDPDAEAVIRMDGIIPWKRDDALGWDVPCLVESGPFRGYFVSQTAWALRPNLPECDIRRYIDSYELNANVVPLDARWKSAGVLTDGFDLVVVRDRGTGRLQFAVNGDRGPPDNLGEGSIALVSAMVGHKPTGKETRDELVAMVLPDVDFLIFPSVDIIKKTGSREFTQEQIDEWGEETLARWAGDVNSKDLLDACYQRSME